MINKHGHFVRISVFNSPPRHSFNNVERLRLCTLVCRIMRRLSTPKGVFQREIGFHVAVRMRQFPFLYRFVDIFVCEFVAVFMGTE